MFLKVPDSLGPPAAYNTFNTDDKDDIVYVSGATTFPVTLTTIDLLFIRDRSKKTLKSELLEKLRPE